MPRTVNHAVYAVRREAFLDAAERLINVKGYEAMSIQDVLDEVDTSRGAFYHYFDSKQELLEAVVDRLADRAMEIASPVLADPELPALAKLERFFGTIARFKAERVELVLAVLAVWQADSNAIVREKLRRMTIARLGPVLGQVIAQGVEEGSFHTPTPKHTAEVLLALIGGLQQISGELFLARKAGQVEFEEVRDTVAAFSVALERVLGAKEGSWAPLDEASLRFWFG